ncbi:MAG: hypothetical protein JNL70_03370 [Saprospiraceae bacterium]|nr:hypothetical protein [Saprospiraceae bacterium]
MEKRENLYFIIGIALLVFVAINLYWWIDLSIHTSMPFEDIKAAYLSRFPTWLQNPLLITFLNIVLLSGSTFFFFEATHDSHLKTVSIVFIVLCWILIAWQVFSLL